MSTNQPIEFKHEKHDQPTYDEKWERDEAADSYGYGRIHSCQKWYIKQAGNLNFFTCSKNILFKSFRPDTVSLSERVNLGGYVKNIWYKYEYIFTSNSKQRHFGKISTCRCHLVVELAFTLETD